MRVNHAMDRTFPFFAARGDMRLPGDDEQARVSAAPPRPRSGRDGRRRCPPGASRLGRAGRRSSSVPPSSRARRSGVRACKSLAPGLQRAGGTRKDGRSTFSGPPGPRRTTVRSGLLRAGDAGDGRRRQVTRHERRQKHGRAGAGRRHREASEVRRVHGLRFSVHARASEETDSRESARGAPEKCPPRSRRRCVRATSAAPIPGTSVRAPSRPASPARWRASRPARSPRRRRRSASPSRRPPPARRRARAAAPGPRR